MSNIRIKQYSLLLLLSGAAVLFGYHIKILFEGYNAFVAGDMNRVSSLALGCISVIFFLAATGMKWYNRCNRDADLLKLKGLHRGGGEEEFGKSMPPKRKNERWIYRLTYAAVLLMGLSCADSFTLALLGKGGVLSSTEIQKNPMDFLIVAAQIAFLIISMRSLLKKIKSKNDD